MIKGQDILLEKINSLNLNAFPHTLILEGYEGSGKHSIAQYISDIFNLELIDITDSINIDMINDIALKTIPAFYLIDLTQLSQKNTFIKTENMILKFIEEPTNNTYIILLVNNRNILLQTITNRAQIWSLAKYSTDLLREFLTEPDLNKYLDLCKTPGDVKKLNQFPIEAMLKDCEKIFTKIGQANFSNMLKILTLLNLDNDKDKYDARFFAKLLLFELNLLYKESKLDNISAIYMLTRDLVNDLNQANLNIKYLYTSYLIKLWKHLRKN